MPWKWLNLGGTILDRPALEPLTHTVVVRGTNNAIAYRSIQENATWKLLSEGVTKIAYAPAVCLVGDNILVLCAVDQTHESPIQQVLSPPWDGHHHTEPAAPIGPGTFPVPLVETNPPPPSYSGEIRELGGWLCDSPAITQYSHVHGYQDLVGRGGDNLYYHARGGVTIARDAWQPIPGCLFSSAPSIAHRNPRFRPPSGPLDTTLPPYPLQRLEVVGRGLDNAIYHATLTENEWSPWATIPGLRTQFAPAIGSLSAHELYAFAVGLDGYLHSAYRPNDESPWSSWRRLDPGPLCTSGPAVMRTGLREMVMCVRGETGNVMLGRAILRQMPRS